MTKKLETERLLLREWKEEDFPLFARINADPLIMEYMPRVLPPKDSDKLVKRFIKHKEKNGYGMYALERKEDGAFMGTVGLNNVEFKAHFTPAVEIAWRLDYEFWGSGYATEAAKRVIQHGFEDVGLEEIVAFTVHDNARSVHVMDRLGMTNDEKGNFDYPSLRKGHPLGKFVLYRYSRLMYQAQKESLVSN